MIANQQQSACVRKVCETLTERQSQILTGLLLGDGHLETQNSGRTFRLKVEHSAAQADYVEWLFAEFREFCECFKPYRRTRKDGRVSVGFTTASSDAFNVHAEHFYVGRQKRIPPRLSDLLSPLGLAIWFMDDGSRKSARHKTYNIHTLGYTMPDLELAQASLEQTLGIRTNLHRQRNDSWRIYIGAHSAGQFKEMILPYLTPIQSMHKKLAH